MIFSLAYLLFCFLIGDEECDNQSKELTSYLSGGVVFSGVKSCTNVSIVYTSDQEIKGTVFFIENADFSLSYSKFDDLNFTRTLLNHAGFLYAVNSTNISVSDSLFNNISVSDLGNGGVFYIILGSAEALFTVSNSSFTSCFANKNGGAIYVSVSALVGTSTTAVNITSCAFQKCIANTTSGGGGAVYLTTDIIGANRDIPTYLILGSTFDSNHVRNSSHLDIDIEGTALAVYNGALDVRSTTLQDWTGVAVLLQATNCTVVLITNSFIRGRHLTNADNDTNIFFTSSSSSDTSNQKHLLGANIFLNQKSGLLSFENCASVSINNSAITDSRHGGIYINTNNESNLVVVENSNFSNNLVRNVDRFPSLRLNFICSNSTTVRLTTSNGNRFQDVVHYTEFYKWYDATTCLSGSEANPDLTIPKPLIYRIEVVDLDTDTDWANRENPDAAAVQTQRRKEHQQRLLAQTSVRKGGFFGRRWRAEFQEVVFSSSSSSYSSSSSSFTTTTPHTRSHPHFHSYTRPLSRRHHFLHSAATSSSTPFLLSSSSVPHAHTHIHTHAHPHTLHTPTNHHTSFTSPTPVPTPAPLHLKVKSNAGYNALKVNGFFLFPLNGSKVVVSDGAESNTTNHNFSIDASDPNFAYVDQHTLIFRLDENFRREPHPNGIKVTIENSIHVWGVVENVSYTVDSVGTIYGQWNPDWRQMDFDDAYGIDPDHPENTGISKAFFRGLIGGIVLIVILAAIVIVFTVFLYFLRKRSIAEYTQLHGRDDEVESD